MVQRAIDRRDRRFPAVALDSHRSLRRYIGGTHASRPYYTPHYHCQHTRARTITVIRYGRPRFALRIIVATRGIERPRSFFRAWTTTLFSSSGVKFCLDECVLRFLLNAFYGFQIDRFFCINVSVDDRC